MQAGGKIETKEKYNFGNYLKGLRNTKVEHAGHDIFESKELQAKKKEHKGRMWPVMTVTPSECPECGGAVKEQDWWKGETTCSKCGLVISEMPLKTEVEDKSLNTEPIVPKDKKMKSRMKGIPATKYNRKDNMKDWRADQYKRTVDTYSSILFMNKSQKERILYILNHNSMKQIHSRLKWRTIVAGVCRYVLEKDGRGRELRYNREPFIWVSLTNKNYAVMKSNLDNLKVLG